MDKKYEYNSPLVYQRADPFVNLHTDGYYYFTGTMPQYDCIEIRRAKTLNGLLTADSEVVWKKHPTGEMGSHINSALFNPLTSHRIFVLAHKQIRSDFPYVFCVTGGEINI